MSTFNEIISLASDSKVELADSFKELIGKELCLGMTRYVARHGTISDNHERITDAERYYASIKEMYYVGQSIREQEVLAIEAQADLIDAMSMISFTKSQRLRKEAAVKRATNKLFSAKVCIQDSMRLLDEFNKIRLELQDKVRAKYPDGIEQSEPDNWVVRAKYKHLKRSFGYSENMTHIPLDKEVKTRLGFEIGAPDLTLWSMVTEGEKTSKIASEYENRIKLLRGTDG